jgi:ATP-binding cassette, subfamily G (WHITE), member 2, PDR
MNKISTDLRTSEYAASFRQQLSTVTRRIFQDHWRDPTYIYSKLALCAGVVNASPSYPFQEHPSLTIGECFFNGITFYNTPLDMQSFINFLFSIFFISQLFSTLDQQIIPRLADGRSLFEAREGRSKTYPWTLFLAANLIVELCWQTVASVLKSSSPGTIPLVSGEMAMPAWEQRRKGVAWCLCSYGYLAYGSRPSRRLWV